MKRIETLIVDDEPSAIEVIKELAGEIAPDIQVVATASNGIMAAEMIVRHRPQLVFVDVQMPLMNGLKFLETVNRHDFQTIITTGDANHALKALKLNVADYLLKPIDPVEFLVSVQKVRERLAGKSETKSPGSKKIQLPFQKEIVFVEEDDIVKVEGLGSYCQVFTIEGQKIVVSKNIGWMEEKLSPDLFVRCHNSRIINIRYVTKFVSEDGHYVVLKDGSQVEVSRRNKDRLLSLLSAL